MDGAWFPPSKGQLTTAVMTKNNVSTTSDRRELRVPWAIHAGVSGELLALLTKQRERVRVRVGLGLRLGWVRVELGLGLGLGLVLG
jgi:hypothetical protein